VKAGDRVRRGQAVARIGASGDAREPHLHFEVTTSSKLLAGEGVPYLIDRYRCKSASDGPDHFRMTDHTGSPVNAAGFRMLHCRRWRILTSRMATKKSHRFSYQGAGGTIQASEPQLWLTGPRCCLTVQQSSTWDAGPAYPFRKF
jgi:murein DD-endopeptidase MepM/ murein hydrolase activator NlpD